MVIIKREGPSFLGYFNVCTFILIAHVKGVMGEADRYEKIYNSRDDCCGASYDTDACRVV